MVKTKTDTFPHSKDVGREEIGSFLTHLTVEKKVARSTQNQALSAFLLHFREVIQKGPLAVHSPPDL